MRNRRWCSIEICSASVVSSIRSLDVVNHQSRGFQVPAKESTSSQNLFFRPMPGLCMWLTTSVVTGKDILWSDAATSRFDLIHSRVNGDSRIVTKIEDKANTVGENGRRDVAGQFHRVTLHGSKHGNISCKTKTEHHQSLLIQIHSKYIIGYWLLSQQKYTFEIEYFRYACYAKTRKS